MDLGEDDTPTRSSTPKLNSGQVSRSASPVVTPSTYPVSVRQQMARIKQIQMEQPSPSGSTDGEQTGPMTPGGGGGGAGPSTSGSVTGPGRKKVPKVHKRNGRGETPLHVAAKRGDVVACEQLLKEGAEVNQSDNAGWTPLHEAATNNKVDCVNFLLRNGANPNAKSAFGDAPLHDAIHGNYVRLVWTLLKAGADIDARCLEFNVENRKEEYGQTRALKIAALLEGPVPPECPESEIEEEESEEERRKERKKKKEEEKKKKKKDEEEESATPPRAFAEQDSAPASASPAPPTTVATAATTVFEAGAVSIGGDAGTVGGGTSASSMHATSHHPLATHILKTKEQQLSVATELSERCLDDPSTASTSSAISRSMPATTPISVIVEDDDEEEEGQIVEKDDEEMDDAVPPTPAAASSLLTIAAASEAAATADAPPIVIDDGEEVDDDDDDESGRLMIDEGDDEEGEDAGNSTIVAAEEEVAAAEEQQHLQQPPTVQVQPPTPVVEKHMELLTLEKIEEEEDEDADAEAIDETEERERSEKPSTSRAYSEDPPSASATRKRKKAGEPRGRKSGAKRAAGAAAAATTGVGVWAKSRRSAEPEGMSAAAAALLNDGDDPFEFHDSSPDPDSSRRTSRGVTMDRELSAPPVAKRQRNTTQSPSPAGDVEMEEEEDEDTRLGSKKVPPLRLVLPPKPADEGDGGDDAAVQPSGYNTTIPTLQTRKQGRGRPAGGRRAADDDNNAQRMTRSKVRQSGRGLEDGEGANKRKRGRGAMATVMEEETGGEETDDAFGSYAATPQMVAGGGGAGAGLVDGTGGVMEGEVFEGLLNSGAYGLEAEIFHLTTLHPMQARAELDRLIQLRLGAMYTATVNNTDRWEPSEDQKGQFLMYAPMPPAAAAAAADPAASGNCNLLQQNPSSQSVQQREAQQVPDAAAAGAAKPPKRNPFEEINEKMLPLWDELKAERAEEERLLSLERVRLRLNIETKVVGRERVIRNQHDQLTLITAMQLQQTCNPQSLLVQPKKPPVEEDLDKFIAHQQSRIGTMWSQHRLRQGMVAGIQISKWRNEANRLGIKRGLKRQLRAFPEIEILRVVLPPIEGYDPTAATVEEQLQQPQPLQQEA